VWLEIDPDFFLYSAKSNMEKFGDKKAKEVRESVENHRKQTMKDISGRF